MKRTTRTLVFIGLAAALGFAAWQWTNAAPAQSKKSQAAAPAAVPVETASAVLSDVPVNLLGIGSAQAFNTVTVTSRVDGQLQKIAFVEGQDVKAGQLIAQIDPRPYQAQLDQAVSKKAQDESQLQNAKQDLQRYQALAPQDYASKQTLDKAVAQVGLLEALVKGDQATIDAARTQLAYTTITSPIGGRTGMRLVDQGNNVRATDTTGIVVITQLHPISVVFTLPEESLIEISKAMSQAKVTVAALSRDGKTELGQGTVSLVDNRIDQTTGTIRLKATFANEANTLWPGQFVNVRLFLRTITNALTVPSAAIGRGPNGLFTYVVKSDGSVEIRPVDVAQDTGTIAVISKGLTPGERVVTAGQSRLQPGAHVQASAQSGVQPVSSNEGSQSATNKVAAGSAR
ncbi:MAG TPA: efflux RND transporter periplasmic adaptor subunit [Burkholderiales bacterium]|jgi:multidrug efflux system membrane fusion protein|nr:efflux RND transporter periplasmic adaptor subunit [Burkholderiales bacterium]